MIASTIETGLAPVIMIPLILLSTTAILSSISAQHLIPSMTATSNLTTSPLPLAPGTLGNCDVYRSYEPSLLYGYSVDCLIFLDDDRVKVNQFMQWNPSMAVTGCHVQPGVRYCVVRDHSVDHEGIFLLPSSLSSFWFFLFFSFFWFCFFLFLFGLLLLFGMSRYPCAPFLLSMADALCV